MLEAYRYDLLCKFLSDKYFSDEKWGEYLRAQMDKLFPMVFYSLKPGADIARSNRNEKHIQLHRPKRIVGLLFCPLSGGTGSSQFFERLNYWHLRSGEYFDFFCAGCGGYSMRADYPNAVEIPNGSDFLVYYSEKAFNDFRMDIQQVSRWEYSGDTDLLLLNTKYNQISKKIDLDFSTAIDLKLARMLNTDTIKSLPEFLESLCQKIEKKSETCAISDDFGVGVLTDIFGESLCGLLPKMASRLWRRGKHFATRNLSR